MCLCVCVCVCMFVCVYFRGQAFVKQNILKFGRSRKLLRTVCNRTEITGDHGTAILYLMIISFVQQVHIFWDILTNVKFGRQS